MNNPTAQTVQTWIELVERFIPKQVAADSLKEMAMYELYHRMKEYAATAHPAALREGEGLHRRITMRKIEKEIRFCLNMLPYGRNTSGMEQTLAEHLFEWLEPLPQEPAQPQSDFPTFTVEQETELIHEAIMGMKGHSIYANKIEVIRQLIRTVAAKSGQPCFTLEQPEAAIKPAQPQPLSDAERLCYWFGEIVEIIGPINYNSKKSMATALERINQIAEDNLSQNQ